MNIFKNNVGRPSNKIKNIRKILVAVVCFIILITTFIILNTSTNKLKGSVTSDYFYVTSDSLLRSSPSTTPNSLIAAAKGTKVTHLDDSKDTENYYYVTIDPSEEENSGFYVRKYSGYILKDRLTKDKTLHDSNRTLKVSYKTHLARNAHLLYKYNGKNGSKIKFGYSFDESERKTGYDLIVNKKKSKSNNYYFDCSAFVSTMLKVTFDLDFLREDGRLYKTYQYYNEVKGMKIGDTSEHFLVVDKVSKLSQRKRIKTSSLQIGDIILGMNKFKITDKGDYNHIMLYVGDGKIIHSSGKKSEKLRYNYLTNEYITVGKNYSQELYVLRLKKIWYKRKRNLQ